MKESKREGITTYIDAGVADKLSGSIVDGHQDMSTLGTQLFILLADYEIMKTKLTQFLWWASRGRARGRT